LFFLRTHTEDAHISPRQAVVTTLFLLKEVKGRFWKQSRGMAGKRHRSRNLNEFHKDNN
jgi:hypothetical protein